MKKPDNFSKLRLSLAVFKGAFVYNPVLTQVLGICPIVAAATTLKSAAVLSAVLSAAVILCETVASIALKKVSRNIRVCLYCLFASVPTLISMCLIDGKTLSALGAFLPLISVNAVIVVRCEKFAVRTNVRNALSDSLACAAGFCAVALVTGFLRELIAYGSIFSLKISALPVFPAVALPFGGLVILGFLSAAQKAVVMSRFKDESTDTFNFSKVFEKPVIHDPGLGVPKGRKKKISQPKTPETDRIRPRYFSENETEGKTI